MYLSANFQQIIWTVEGPEFGSDKGMVMVFVRALYELRSYGEVFRGLLDEQLHDLGYSTSISDPDVWMRLSVKPGGFM